MDCVGHEQEFSVYHMYDVITRHHAGYSNDRKCFPLRDTSAMLCKQRTVILLSCSSSLKKKPQYKTSHSLWPMKC